MKSKKVALVTGAARGIGLFQRERALLAGKERWEICPAAILLDLKRQTIRSFSSTPSRLLP